MSKSLDVKGTKFDRYRSTKISLKEANMLQLNVSRLITTNSYWSSSSNRIKTLNDANGFSSDTDKLNVLFEIQCDLDKSDNIAIIVDISKLSTFPTEYEL